MNLTAAQISASCGCGLPRAENWLDPISTALAAFDVNQPARAAAFLAQVGHESGGLRYMREIWGPTEAQSRYDQRRDLGNVQPGDGFRYRGRGLIQVTGRHNYAVARDELRKMAPGAPDFEAQPELLEAPRWAALSAACYWKGRGLNELADKSDMLTITKRINGGTNGLADRMRLWEDAKKAMGVQS